jgi:hypothetical protein
MTSFSVLAPVFAQVALTLGLVVATGRSRVAALRNREVRMQDIALGQDAWPPRVTAISRAYQNQIEAPTLFYAAVAMAMAAGLADKAFIGLEWAFVIARLAHAYVHVTSNFVPRRFQLFVVSIFVLAALWIWLALRSLGVV